jgi:beta-mannosidase
MRNLVVLITAFLAINILNTKAMGQIQTLSWELGYAEVKEVQPGKWVAATVPGAVQLDIARAEKYAPLVFADNWKDYLWMENSWFTYRTHFNKPELNANERLVFVSKGIDYQFEIILNGEKIFAQEGMFTPVNLDLTDKLINTNTLQIIVFPAPKSHNQNANRSQATYSVKPPVSYGWDWHPRLIPSGIWDETYLQVLYLSHVENIQVDYTLNSELTSAKITLKADGQNLEGVNFDWKLKDKNDVAVITSKGRINDDQEIATSHLENPNLWWPHDHGEPYLYTSEFKLTDNNGKILQTATSKIGFRRVKLVMNEGAWDDPKGFPKTRSVPPIQMEINGRKIFSKGTNWVNPEIFPGKFTRERYSELLILAKECNFNLLRVWGGGPVNKESFFELCDELGILVWQEFPLACNPYPDDERYLKILAQESASIIKRVKKHPSLALWSGGNELFNGWSGMTDQSLALRLLNSQCFRLDPTTPFIPTSPLMGMGHGHYVFRDWDTKEEVFQQMTRSRYTAYTEFGMPSPASVAILKTIIPENELWPPKPGTAWESHHAYNAWVGNTWLCQDIIEDYFGKSESLEQLVANGQLLQSEGYKCIFEEARRQKPYCSMALNWCYDEPWPAAANNSLISYPAIPKPGFFAVKNACRPVLVSARLPKFKWKAGETFHAEIWMLNDFYKSVPGGKVTIKLVQGDKKIVLLNWEYTQMEPNINQAGPTVRYTLPEWDADRFTLLVEVEGCPEYNSEYTLAYQPVNPTKKQKQRLMNQ